MTRKNPLQIIKNNVWKTVTIVVTIFSVIAGVWAIEDRYANKTEIQTTVNNLQTQQENFQEQQRTFQEQQDLSVRERKIEIYRAKLEFYGIIKDDLTKEISDSERWLDLHPDDTIIESRIKKLEKSRDRVQERIDSLMEKLGEVN